MQLIRKITKNLLILFVGLGVSACQIKFEDKTNSYSGEYDFIISEFNGNVHLIEEYSYEAIDSFGTVIRGARKRRKDILGIDEKQDTRSFFDKKGNLIKYETLDNHNNTTGTWLYENFDEHGNATKLSFFNKDSSEYQLFKRSYNKNNKLATEQVFDLNKLVESTIYKSDEENNKKESIYKDGQGKIILKIISKHNLKSNTYQSNYYGSDGRLIIKELKTYDDNDRFILEKCYNSKGEEIYFEENEWINSNYYKELIKQTSSEYEAFKKFYHNFLISRILFKDHPGGWMEGIYIYPYIGNEWFFKINSNGNLIEQKSLGKKNVEYTFSYKYDTLGNWLIRTEYLNEIPEFFIQRNIEYYEK